MSTTNYAKDYNPLRITDLWKYERPRDINREGKPRGKPSGKSIPISIYDSVDDVIIEAKSRYAMSKKIGCSQNSLWKLYNEMIYSIAEQRFFRTKEDFIEYQSKIEIFDTEKQIILTFTNKIAASKALSISLSSICSLFNGNYKSIMSGRYTLVK